MLTAHAAGRFCRAVAENARIVVDLGLFCRGSAPFSLSVGIVYKLLRKLLKSVSFMK